MVKNDTLKGNKAQKSDDDTNQMKKRGRPRKNVIQTKNLPTIKSSTKIEKNKDIDEQIILHIPLYDEEESSSSEKNVFTMKDNSESEDDEQTTLRLSQNTSESDVTNNYILKIKNLKTELKKKDVLIKKLKNSINLTKTDVYDNHIGISKDTKMKMMNLKLINIKDNLPVVVDKTDISCWWCTYNFDTIPCFIPDRYINDKYYVFGCFCNYSCALAYNINMGDYRITLRSSLIKKLYSHIFSSSEPIPMAPPRELLQKYGGSLTIDEFRDKSNLCTKNFKMLLPPLIPLLPMVEESQRDLKTTSLKNKK